jgi:hypothetical protein
MFGRMTGRDGGDICNGLAQHAPEGAFRGSDDMGCD